MVSVIIPVYNVAAYLPRCLDSLTKQDFEGAMEIILVDDGSTDSSAAICQDFCRTCPQATLHRQENKGLSEARNAGIKAASGEWLFFLDADDWLAPQALSKLLSYADANVCDMVIGSFYYAFDDHLLYDDRWFNGQEPFILSREDAMRELILQHFFKNFAWGKLYRADVVKKHPFRPGVYFEDSYWQHLIVHEMQRIGVIPEPLYYYRQRTDSISGSFSARNLDLLKGNEERLHFIIDHYPSLTEIAVRGFWSLCFQQQEMAKETAPEVGEFWQRVQKDYGHQFRQALRHNPLYLTVSYCPQLTKVLLFARRGYDHLFARRPKTIPLTT